jgi:hypothetical protein
MKHQVLFVMAALAAMGGCTDTTTVPVDLVSADDRVYGTFVLSGQQIMRAGNPIGPLIITGEAVDTAVEYYANRVAAAPTADEARAAVTRIMITSGTSGDSLIVGVTIAPPPDENTYGCLLSLDAPFLMPLVVNGVGDDVTLEDRFGDVTVRNARGVTLTRHVASADISIDEGPLSLQVAPPDTGRIWAVTVSGDIELSIPETSPATFTVRAAEGTITVTDLPLDNVVQSSGSLTATLAGGGADIRLETKKGNVILKKSI